MFVEFVLVLCLIYHSDAGCPSMCNCSSKIVSCAEQQLHYVPNFNSLIHKSKIIDLSGNSINDIAQIDFSFDYSIYVRELYLNCSEIVDVNGKAFNEFTHLQALYLGDNLLNNISENLIVTLEEMTLMDLSGNHFNDLPKINSKSLEVLVLANSKISNVPLDSLDGLPNLRLLLLQQNNIQYISAQVFQNVKYFHFVKLTMNPWPCNTETEKFFKYLLDRRFIDEDEELQCLNNKNEYMDVIRNGELIRNNRSLDLEIPNLNEVLNNEEYESFSGDDTVEFTEISNDIEDAIDVMEREELLLKNIEVTKNEMNSTSNASYIHEIAKNESNYSLLKLENKTTVPDEEGNVIFVQLEENYNIYYGFGFIIFICGMLFGVLFTYILMRTKKRKQKKCTNSTTLLIAPQLVE